MKLINESLQNKFTKGSDDKLSTIGIGRIHLIENWLDEMNIKDYEIRPDFSIDVNNTVKLSRKGLIKFPYYIQFNHIFGIFTCSNNDLISLEGCPYVVDDVFYCDYNNLTSLEFCPTHVGSIFGAEHNNITTLKNCPLKFSRTFFIDNNPILPSELVKFAARGVVRIRMPFKGIEYV